MCNFITLIVPTANVEAVKAVMELHGRRATPIDNPSIRKILHDSEHQYLTTSDHCDCDTFLGFQNGIVENPEEMLAKEVSRNRRKGWSEAKIARAIEDRSRVSARRVDVRSDSIELWNNVLHDLQKKLKLSHAGLFVRFYSGSIENEVFKALRSKVAKKAKWQDALASLEYDEVTVFPFN